MTVGPEEKQAIVDAYLNGGDLPQFENPDVYHKLLEEMTAQQLNGTGPNGRLPGGLIPNFDVDGAPTDNQAEPLPPAKITE